jgi:hypothetical protein
LSSSRTGRRFLPPRRPRPHPVLASKVGTTVPSCSIQQISRPKGMTLRDSMDLSRVRVGELTTNANVNSAKPNQIPHNGGNVSKGELAPVDDGSGSQERPHLVATEPNHTKTASPATVNKVPTTISALMLQNLRTPAHFRHGTMESIIAPNASMLTKTTRFGSQRFGSSTRIPPPSGTSSIRARIAMFEQAQANNIPDSARVAQSTRNTSGNCMRV